VKRLEGKPFVLLGVNSDKDREALKKTLVDEQINWRSWWDEGRIDGPIHTTWQIPERPAIRIIDHKGVIRYSSIQPEAVDEAVDRLLAELEREGKE
jgi:hypothetical protein